MPPLIEDGGGFSSHFLRPSGVLSEARPDRVAGREVDQIQYGSSFLRFSCQFHGEGADVLESVVVHFFPSFFYS
jgi:hypothetical protein